MTAVEIDRQQEKPIEEMPGKAQNKPD